MTVNEARKFLGLSRDQTKDVIEVGIELPKSKTIIKLRAAKLTPEGEYDIEEEDIDEYKKAFDAEEPGRHPPVAVCRALLVEARHRCGICRERISGLQFHHLIDFSRFKHYDVRHMLAVCPTCHGRCTVGEIDRIAQKAYKNQLCADIQSL